jgi:predicted dehydrogenase
MISLVLVGVRGFGSRHLREIRQLESKGLARLAALVDPAFGQGLQAKELAFTVAHGLPRYSSLDEFLADGVEFDALSMATPIHLHEEMLHRLCPTGKFIYVEKPPVPTISQLDRLLASHQNSQVAVAFQLIASPCVRRLKELILEGQVGEILSISASGGWPRDCSYYSRNSWAGRLRAPDGRWIFDGVATNAFAHLVHLVTYLAGDEIDTFAVPTRTDGYFLQARPVAAPDTVFLGGEFSGGASYQIAVTHCSRREHAMELRVFGTNGTATLSNDASEVTVNGSRVARSGGHDEAIALAYEDFIGYADGRLSRPAVRLPDCRGYLAATWGAFEAGEGIEPANPARVSTVAVEGGLQFVLEGVDHALAECLKGESRGLQWTESARANRWTQRENESLRLNPLESAGGYYPLIDAPSEKIPGTRTDRDAAMPGRGS